MHDHKFEFSRKLFFFFKKQEISNFDEGKNRKSKMFFKYRVKL